MLLITASGLNVMQAVTARFFSGMRDASPSEVSDYISSFLNVFAFLIVPLMALVFQFRMEIASVAAPGLSPEMQQLTADLILILTPLSAFFGFGLFFGGVYAAFAMPVTAELVLLTTRMLSVMIVVAGLFFGVDVTPQILCLTLLITATGSALWLYWLSRRRLGFRYRPTLVYAREIISSVGAQAVLFLIVAVIGQAVIVYYRSILSVLDVHLVAAFSYALLITYTFSNVVGKLGFFQMTVPIHEKFESSQLSEYRSTIMRNAGLYGALSAVLAVAMLATSEFLIKLFFGGGEFGPNSVAAVRLMFDILVLSIPATTLIWILKLPSITGVYRLALPASEILVWIGLFLLLLTPPVSSSPEVMVTMLVVSYWLRVVIAVGIIALQISAKKRDQELQCAG